MDMHGVMISPFIIFHRRHQEWSETGEWLTRSLSLSPKKLLQAEIKAWAFFRISGLNDEKGVDYSIFLHKCTYHDKQEVLCKAAFNVHQWNFFFKARIIQRRKED